MGCASSAALYLAKARREQERAQIERARRLPAAGVTSDAISARRQSRSQPTRSRARSRRGSTGSVQSGARRRTGGIREAVKHIPEDRRAASPKDPNVQLELAQAAQQAGDTVTAIAAYKAFLRLAPDDPTALDRRAQQLKQLARQSRRRQVGLDSPGSSTASGSPPCDCRHVARASLARSSSRRAADAAATSSEGSQGAGKELFVAVCGTATPLPTREPTGRSGRTSTTRSPRRATARDDPTTFTQVVRDQIQYPDHRSLDGRSGDARPSTTTLPGVRRRRGRRVLRRGPGSGGDDIAAYVGAVAGYRA